VRARRWLRARLIRTPYDRRQRGYPLAAPQTWRRPRPTSPCSSRSTQGNREVGKPTAEVTHGATEGARLRLRARPAAASLPPSPASCRRDSIGHLDDAQPFVDETEAFDSVPDAPGSRQESHGLADAEPNRRVRCESLAGPAVEPILSTVSSQPRPQRKSAEQQALAEAGASHADDRRDQIVWDECSGTES
jgi:hypothetical protein